jgi:hypothetical protein
MRQKNNNFEMDFFWRWQLQLTKASVFVNGAELCMRDCAKR